MIEIVPRPVYRATTANRSYITLKGAAVAEANALLKRKYPTEPAEYNENGMGISAGWHWSSDERLVRVHQRLARSLVRRFRMAMARNSAQEG